jgi:hypothetical protein
MLDIYVVEHPRCGATWLQRLLSDILRAELVSGINSDGSFNSRYWGTETVEDRYRIFKSHSYEKQGKSILVIRDPRDMFVSAWAYHTFKHNLYETCRKYILEDYYNTNEDHYGRFEGFVRHWLPLADYIIKYEDIHTTPFLTLDKAIYAITGERVSGQAINNAIFNQDYHRVRALYPELEHSVWRGQVGTWKEFFTRREADLVQATIGDLMMDLGYITSPDWVHEVKG